MKLSNQRAEWLLDTDPALRWQVERDLLGSVQAVRSKRPPNGGWLPEWHQPGQTWFAVDAMGQPSPSLTRYALRVLNWFDGNDRAAA